MLCCTRSTAPEWLQRWHLNAGAGAPLWRALNLMQVHSHQLHGASSVKGVRCQACLCSWFTNGKSTPSRPDFWISSDISQSLSFSHSIKVEFISLSFFFHSSDLGFSGNCWIGGLGDLSPCLLLTCPSHPAIPPTDSPFTVPIHQHWTVPRGQGSPDSWWRSKIKK